jgi:predicted small metal-binding protein
VVRENNEMESFSTMQVCIEHEPIEIERKRKSGNLLGFCVCKDLGMDCSFEATGTTEIEVMRKFIDHAGSAHNMELLTADVIYRIQKAIKK